MTTAPITMDQALLQSGPVETRSIVLGNGFSIAQTQGQLSYTNLLEQSNLPATSPIRTLFTTLDTVDFEEVVEALEHAAKVEGAYNDATRRALFEADAQVLRESLIHAIRAVHPANITAIPDAQFVACYDFLRNFTTYYTLNYDLLLYWANLKNDTNLFTDGFGLESAVNGFRAFNPKGHCNVYNLHGGLHLFPRRDGGTGKRIASGEHLLDSITDVIENAHLLPTFVAEGTSTKKMSKINSNAYLNHCYRNLKEKGGSIFVFGHAASPNDHHIYEAIYEGNPGPEVYFCVRDLAQLTAVQRRLAQYPVAYPKSKTYYVDVSTFNVWGN
jgi:Domain of unknown function (DUF4917)